MSAGGFHPTASQDMWRVYQAQAGLDRMRYALLNDQRTYGAADLVSRLATGGSLSDMRGSNPAGYGLAMNAMAAVNNMGWLGGGNPATMMEGIHRATSRGGFQVTGMNPIMNQTIRGSGGITEQVSRQIYDGMSGHFFSPSGAAIQSRTHGLNKSDIGEIFDMMQSQGSFAGMNVGKMEGITSLATVRQLGEKARKAGDMGLLNKIAGATPITAGGDPYFLTKDVPGAMSEGSTVVVSEASTQAVAKKVEEMTKSLSRLRGLFGGMPMQELAREAERISGVSLAGPNGVADVGRRIESASLTARAYGVDEQRYLNTIAAGAGMSEVSGRLGADPMFQTNRLDMAISHKSSLMGMEGFEQARASRASLAKRGIYTPERSMEEMMGRQIQVSSQFVAQEKTAIAAMAALDYSGASAEDRAVLEGIANELGSATTKDQRREINSRLREETLRRTGLDTTALLKNKSVGEIVAGLSTRSNETLAGIGTQASQANLVNSFRKVSASLNLGGGANEGLNAFFTTFGKSQGLMIDALESGGLAGMEKLLNTPGGPGSFLSEEERGKVMSQMRDLESKGGDRSLATVLKQASSSLATNKELADLTLSSKEGRLDSFYNRSFEWIKENRLGSQSSNLSVMDLFVEGMLGGGQVPDMALIKNAASLGDTPAWLKLTGKAGFEALGAGDYDKLNAAIADSGGKDLAGMMGVGSQAEAIKLLGTPEGLLKFQEEMAATGMKGVFDEKGNYAVLGAGASGRGSAALEKEMFGQLAALVGDSSIAGDNDVGLKDLMKRNLGDLSVLAADDVSDPQGDLFKAYLAKNTDMIPLLQEEADRLMEEAGQTGDRASKSKMTTQAEAMRKLHDDMKSGSGKYVGKMEVTVGGKGDLTIFEKQGDGSAKIGHQ